MEGRTYSVTFNKGRKNEAKMNFKYNDTNKYGEKSNYSGNSFVSYNSS